MVFNVQYNVLLIICHLNSCYLQIQDSNSEAQNRDVQAAKVRRSKLIALKEKLASDLESNRRLRATLQEQLHSLW